MAAQWVVPVVAEVPEAAGQERAGAGAGQEAMGEAEAGRAAVAEAEGAAAVVMAMAAGVEEEAAVAVALAPGVESWEAGEAWVSAVEVEAAWAWVAEERAAAG